MHETSTSNKIQGGSPKFFSKYIDVENEICRWASAIFVVIVMQVKLRTISVFLFNLVALAAAQKDALYLNSRILNPDGKYFLTVF